MRTFKAVVLFCLLCIVGCADAPPPSLNLPAEQEDIKVPMQEFVLGQAVSVTFVIKNIDPNCVVGAQLLDENQSNCPNWLLLFPVEYYKLTATATGRSFVWHVAVPEAGKHYHLQWRIFTAANAFTVPGQQLGWANPVAMGVSEKFFVRKPSAELVLK